jgi:hypothetical protein
MRVLMFVLCLSLVLVGVAPAADSLHVRAIGHYASDIPGWTESGAGYDIAGDYAYLVGHGSFLVLSVADPAQPALVGSCGWDSIVKYVKVVGGYAYVADGWDGLHIASVADPAHPVEVGRCSLPGMSQCVAVSGSHAYVVADSYGLRVVSIADPSNPTEVGYCDTPGRASKVKVVGDYAYVADISGGLRIISVRDPTHPAEVGAYIPGLISNVATVEVSGDYAYLGCFSDRSFRIISIADPTHPFEVGSLDSLGYFVQEARLVGNYAFAATSYATQGALRVFSLADPTRMTEVGYYVTPGACFYLGLFAPLCG